MPDVPQQLTLFKAWALHCVGFFAVFTYSNFVTQIYLVPLSDVYSYGLYMETMTAELVPLESLGIIFHLSCQG
jgi:hypothetical protein